MSNQKQNSNSNSKGNFRPNKNQRPKKRYVPKDPVVQQASQRPQRRRRVTVDRDVEVVIVSNSLGRFYYEHPRMASIIDLHHIGDEEYVTVGDLRTILNTSRGILERFDILITEVMDDRYELEDVLLFLGLDRKYEEYFSLNGSKDGGFAQTTDIKDFLVNTPAKSFERIMDSIDPKLRAKIIEIGVTLFKLKEFGDYNKMRIIERYVSDELFSDAEETEVDPEIFTI